MELPDQKPLKRVPKVARPQMSPVVREEHHVCFVVPWPDFVRASQRSNAAFDAKPLTDHFEPQNEGRLYLRDTLQQFSFFISAAKNGPNNGFRPICSQRVWQQSPQRKWRPDANVLVQHYFLPHRLRGGGETNCCSHCIGRHIAREKPADGAKRSSGDRGPIAQGTPGRPSNGYFCFADERSHRFAHPQKFAIRSPVNPISPCSHPLLPAIIPPRCDPHHNKPGCVTLQCL